MKIVEKAAVAGVAAVGAAVAAFCCAPQAGADRGNDPCELAIPLLCKFMPVAPDLDHDIDLTQNSATINGTPVPRLPASNPTTAEAAPPVP